MVCGRIFGQAFQIEADKPFAASGSFRGLFPFG
jgi:hypothetical protein